MGEKLEGETPLAVAVAIRKERAREEEQSRACLPPSLLFVSSVLPSAFCLLLS